jgi:antitoxin component YwqK of YwqJK toxin-antitoxin module
MTDKEEIINLVDKLGRKHGFHRSFYSNDNVFTECNYVHGILQGKYTYYNKNKKWLEFNYVNRAREGENVSYSINWNAN